MGGVQEGSIMVELAVSRKEFCSAASANQEGTASAYHTKRYAGMSSLIS